MLFLISFKSSFNIFFVLHERKLICNLILRRPTLIEIKFPLIEFFDNQGNFLFPLFFKYQTYFFFYQVHIK